MKIRGDYTFEAPQDVVWEALQDPTVLASVLPGCEKLERTGDDQYEGALKIKVGPVQGKFQGKIQLTDIQEPESYKMQVDGRGAPGFVKATAEVKLAGEGEKTVLTYDSDARVGGRIASVGQRLLDSSAKAIIRQSLEGLNATLIARAHAAAGGAEEAADEAGEEKAEGARRSPPPPSPRQPSQAEFAAGVAREIAKDLVPPHLRAPLVIGAVVLFLLLLFRLIPRR